MTSQTRASSVGESLTEELIRQYGDRVPEGRIAAFVNAALSDLRGSVAAEALPEMAARLAMLRIERYLLAPDGHHRIPEPRERRG